MPAPDRILSDLDTGLEQVLSLIGRAAVDSRSPMRWPVLSTQALAGGGSARTVVLRAFDRKGCVCSIWTDRRSEKVNELKAEPGTCLLFFDPAKKLQIRAFGSLSVKTGGPEHVDALQRAQQGTMDDYASPMGPGHPIDGPKETSSIDDPSSNFALLIMRVTEIDVLELSRQGHRRALFQTADGTFDGHWRVP